MNISKTRVTANLNLSKRVKKYSGGVMVKIRKKPINRLKYINPAVNDEYKLQIIKHKREKKEMVIRVLKLIIESFALMTLR